MPVDDSAPRYPKIGKVQRLLGWQPKTGLTPGLERMLAYSREKAALARGATA